MTAPTLATLPGVPGCGLQPPTVDLIYGTLSFQYRPASGSTAEPPHALWYNALSTGQTPAGYGWSRIYDQKLIVTDATSAQIVQADGRRRDYANLSGGQYQSTSGANDILKANADGSFDDVKGSGESADNWR